MYHLPLAYNISLCAKPFARYSLSQRRGTSRIHDILSTYMLYYTHTYIRIGTYRRTYELNCYLGANKIIERSCYKLSYISFCLYDKLRRNRELLDVYPSLNVSETVA